MRLHTSRTLALAVAALAVAPSAASAKKAVLPTVTSFSPKQVQVGQKLTIIGKHFRAGANRNTVVFKRDGKLAVFAKVGSATTTKLVVTVPQKLVPFMAQKDGATVATKFRMRVLSAKFSRSFSTLSNSPMVLPTTVATAPVTTPDLTKAPATTDTPAVVLTPYEQCQADAPAAPDADADSDGLSNLREQQIGTDPCTADTDQDGMVDGYEYASAVDLNSFALPYPGKRPYPNALDSSDGGYDFDGDGLTLSQEYVLWKFKGGTFPVTQYSDGTQNSGGSVPATTAAQQTLDLDADGNLTDDERDADGDRLSNQVEFNMHGKVGWWTSRYPNEKPYLIAAFVEPDPAMTDTDGDGVIDGDDDQDHDGYTNFQEMQLGRERSTLVMQAYNPCLPNPYSPVCSRYVPFENAWPPFDGSEPLHAKLPFQLDGALDPNPNGGWNGKGGPQGP